MFIDGIRAVSYTHLDVYKRQADDVKVFVQDDNTVKFVFSRGELNKQVDRISEIEKSISTIKTSTSSLEDSITNSIKQIKKDVEHLVKEIVDKERPSINADEDSIYQRKQTVVGPVFAKAPTFDGSIHWAKMCIRDRFLRNAERLCNRLQK